MTQNIIRALVALGAVVVLLVAGLTLFGGQHLGGAGAYEALQTRYGNGLYVGQTGTLVSGINWKSCSLIASSFTVAASTTVPMDCAITGAVSTDFVMAQFGTTTVPGATTGGWRIVGASASSTAGYDTIQLRNDTGTSAVIPAQIASSTNVLNIR
jgi:hypothetical protein